MFIISNLVKYYNKDTWDIKPGKTIFHFHSKEEAELGMMLLDDDNCKIFEIINNEGLYAKDCENGKIYLLRKQNDSVPS